MNGLETVGKLLMVVGGVLTLLGGLLWLLSGVGILGHMPGDFRIERPGFTCLVPLTSSIVISILLTVVLNAVIQIVRLILRR